MNNVSVRVCDLPHRVDGFVVRAFDSGEIFYTILLNAHVSYERQMSAFEHEMNHIRNDDFTGYSDPDIIEYERHL